MIQEQLIKANIPNPKKTATASGGNYSYQYATLGDVLGVIEPILSDLNLGVKQNSNWFEPIGGFVLETWVYSGDEEKLMDIRPLRDLTNAQEVGSWETYMRRYALCSVFGLCGEDDDGEATINAKPQPKTKKPTSNPKVAQILATAREATTIFRDAGGNPEKILEWARANIRDCEPSEFTQKEAQKFADYCQQMANDMLKTNRG